MTLSEQFTTLLAMTAMGGWFGLSLATYHRFVNPKHRRTITLFVSDILFWVIQGLLVFWVLLELNEGQIRFYLLLALGVGFSAYKALLEGIYKNLLERFISIIGHIIGFFKRLLYHLIIQPTIFLLQLSLNLGKIISRFILAVVLFILSAVYLPFKWLFRLIIPDYLKVKATKWLNQLMSFLTTIKKQLQKVIQWFKPD